MTWIVGTVPPFGYSILVSDIQVSWLDGTQRDCLQKIHKVGDDFLCGFAGSVRLGFEFLRTIAEQLPTRLRGTPPLLVSDWIPSLARWVFRAAAPEERRLGCQLIIAAAHPSENLGDVPWPRTYVWTLDQRNNFDAKACGPDEAVGIGSGSVVSTYTTALRDARRNSIFLKLITHGEGAQTTYLARTMHKSVLKDPKPGVSRFFQMGILTRGRAWLGGYSYTHFDQNGAETQVRVPPVAQSYGAFQDFCKSEKLSAAGAVC
jgi:hypothetical protein